MHVLTIDIRVHTCVAIHTLCHVLKLCGADRTRCALRAERRETRRWRASLPTRQVVHDRGCLCVRWLSLRPSTGPGSTANMWTLACQ